MKNSATFKPCEGWATQTRTQCQHWETDKKRENTWIKYSQKANQRQVRLIGTIRREGKRDRGMESRNIIK